MKTRKHLPIILAVIVLVAAALACGSNTSGEKVGESGPATTTAPAQLTEVDVDKTIELRVDQTIQALERDQPDIDKTIDSVVVQTISAMDPTSAPEPTNTQTPQKETYIVTSGSCLGFKPRYIPTGDPVGFEYCDIDERRQMPLSSGDAVTFSSFMPFSYPSFCAIHTLDGDYITSDVDVDGLGEAVCTLP